MKDEFCISTRSYFGADILDGIVDDIEKLNCQKVLLVTDKLVAKIGAVEKVCNLLSDKEIAYKIYDGVVPNPTIRSVECGLETYKEACCDSIIAVGGGSSIDCAKAIGLLAKNGGEIADYEGVDVSKNAMTPLIAVTTTSGTGSEITRFSIITNEETRVKMAIIDWNVTPYSAYIDFDLMATMPPNLTASTGMDALTHAVEAYISTASTSLTDATAIKSIEKIANHLPKAVANGKDVESRKEMAVAQYMAATAFNHASLGFVHAMAHQLGGMYDLPHGVCNAVLLPYVCEFNLIGNLEKFKHIAVALGESVVGDGQFDAAKKAIVAIRRLSEEIGIPTGLSELGVRESDLEALAENAMKDPCSDTNPRTASIDQIVSIYKNAL